MNFAALKQELSDRGFSYLSDPRLGNFVNFARNELDETALWPYRTITATGAAPLSLSDLDTVESVADLTNGRNVVAHADRRDLAAIYGDLTTAGTPIVYYVDGASVATFPVASSIEVRYYRFLPDMSSGSDTPACPARFHRLIVDLAAERAYRDDDNHQAAEQLRVAIERDLMVMRRALLISNVDGPQSSVQMRAGWSYA